jgi:hypothetical protein
VVLWKIVQILKVSTSNRSFVSGDRNSLSYGLCERTGQSTHPTATNVPESEWKWIDNHFDKTVQPDKILKIRSYRQIRATWQNSERAFRQVIAARKSSKTESVLTRQCSPKRLRENISTSQYNLKTLWKFSNFDRVVQPEKTVRFFLRIMQKNDKLYLIL